jgi:hypothetical protein
VLVATGTGPAAQICVASAQTEEDHMAEVGAEDGENGDEQEVDHHEGHPLRGLAYLKE